MKTDFLKAVENVKNANNELIDVCGNLIMGMLDDADTDRCVLSKHEKDSDSVELFYGGKRHLLHKVFIDRDDDTLSLVITKFHRSDNRYYYDRTIKLGQLDYVLQCEDIVNAVEKKLNGDIVLS